VRRRPKTSPEVELTPLIDVLFMLIVFLVLTTTFAKGQLDVTLPKAKGVPSTSEPIIIEILEGGAIKIGNQEVKENNLKTAIENMVIKDRAIVVAADKDLPYEKVIFVLDVLKEAGISEAGLLVEEQREN